MTIKIDKEFKSLLQPLLKEEYDQLKQNLISDGCREPLVLWGEIIVDGHNRFEICNAFGVAYKTVQKDFKDRQEAMDWIDKNQLGRRNLTDNQKDLIMHRVYERRLNRSSFKGNQHTKSGGRQNDDNQTMGRTSEVVGKEMGVSRRTVERAADFGRAIESLGDLGEEVKAKIQNGEKVIKKDVIAAAKCKAEGDDDMAEKIIKEGTKVPFIPSIAPDDITEKIKFIFEQAKLFDKWDRAVLDIRKDVLAHAGTNPAMAYIYKPFFKQALDKLREQIQMARPTEICTDCKGHGGLCDNCKGTGFLVKGK